MPISYLSANEVKKMESLGEQYWLYRVYEFSEEAKTAKLSAFRGQSAINESFVYETRTYVFRRPRQ